jgi:hypothetical protein
MGFVTSTTGGTANSNVDTSFTASIASPVVGDLNIVWVNATNGTATAPTITPPAGWTTVGTSIVDGSAPQLTANVYYRLYQSGDTVSPVWNFSGGSNATYTMVAYTGVDQTTPVTDARVDAYAGTTTAKTTGTITTTGPRIIVSGFGDRNAGVYTANTDTFRAVSTHSAATSSWVQDSDTEVTLGSQARTATGPSTSVGSSFILAVKLVGASGVQASVATATGTAYRAMAMGSPIKEWWLDRGSYYIAHRGGSADYVEHTLNAYQTTNAKVKYRAMEISTWMTTDGVWLASHDRLTDRMFGAGQSIDIPTNTYAAVMAATAAGTTNGGYPMAKVTDIIDSFDDQIIWYIENKRNTNATEFFAMLDAYPNASNRFVIKNVYNATTIPQTARSKGYKNWGYYYEADLVNLDSTYQTFDMLGMDYTASTDAWTTILAKGLPVIGHVCLTAANIATAFSKGAVGVMTGKVLSGPNAPATVATAVGVAYDAAATPQTTAAPASLATAVGTAFDATVSASAIGAPAVLATAIGTAFDAVAVGTPDPGQQYFTTPTMKMRTGIRHGLWGRIYIDEGISILRFGDSIQQIDEPSAEQISTADAVFIGGRTYAVSAEEAQRLTDAGYGAYLGVTP